MVYPNSSITPNPNYYKFVENGFFGFFDAPRSERSWIDLFNKETQNLLSGSFGFKNPILDFLKETHPWDFLGIKIHTSSTLSITVVYSKPLNATLHS